MNLPFNFNLNFTSLILILLGLLSIMFPMISSMTISLVTGFMFLMFGLSLFVTGAAGFQVNRKLGAVTILVAVLSLIFSWLLMFNPNTLSWITSFIVYIFGFFMVIGGLLSFLASGAFRPMKGIGVSSIIFGIIYILVAIYLASPVHLGIVIGLWLIVSGLMSATADKKHYVDI